MKNLLTLFLLLLLLVGCTEKLVFESKTFLQKTTIPCPTQCPQIKVEIPIASSGTVADSINAKVFSTLSEIIDFGEKPSNAKTYAELLKSFIDSYEKMQREAPDELFGFEGDVKARVVFQSERLLNIEIKHYTFTGGAHGYSGYRSLLFDPVNGKSVETQSLFKDYEVFRKFAESQFREKFDIPEGTPINSKGLMFDDDRFELPQNIFFTPQGIVLYYNAYEIASYAEGAKELKLPYEKVDQFLKIK